VLGVTYEPSRMLDEDLDTVSDRTDACPSQPEDFDGFEDTDGCPELDNDHDQIADAADACPNVAEDRDNVQDQDGCPEAAVRVAITVRDTQGHPVEMASVMIYRESQLLEEDDGSAMQTELDPGRYGLRVEALGYETLETTFEVAPDEELNVSVVLTSKEKPVVSDGEKGKEPIPAAREKRK
jgi:hypothetical protein